MIRITILFLLFSLTSCGLKGGVRRKYVISHSDLEDVAQKEEIEEEEECIIPKKDSS